MHKIKSELYEWEVRTGAFFSFQPFNLLAVTRSFVNKWTHQRILCFFRLFLHFQNSIVALFSSPLPPTEEDFLYHFSFAVHQILFFHLLKDIINASVKWKYTKPVS